MSSPKYIKTKVLTTCFSWILREQKEIWYYYPCLIFCLILKENYFTIFSINWQNFIAWLPSLLEILGNMCSAIICFPVYDVISFEINLSFLIKPLKSQDKNVNTLQTKNPFNMK